MYNIGVRKERDLK